MNLIKRRNYFSELEKLCGEHIIKVVSGLRRAGKSTLLEMFADSLRQKGVDEQCIQQYNFEKPVFPENYSWRDVYDFVTAKIRKDTMNYIFLDEPQQIRRL